ncbi:MAG: hypothetical protein HFI92_11410 [Lachnospiraceae bacterium]|nr:hypothetical protein [Lachnospiraceae bacterium]
MKQAETGPVETGIRNCYNITIKEMLRNISGIVSAASGCGAGSKQSCEKDEEEADHE